MNEDTNVDEFEAARTSDCNKEQQIATGSSQKAQYQSLKNSRSQ
jgi:hypothetical protein